MQEVSLGKGHQEGTPPVGPWEVVDLWKAHQEDPLAPGMHPEQLWALWMHQEVVQEEPVEAA
jgi:hypothetical protein